MMRNALGSLVALVGAAAAVYSPFRNWYDGRHGSEYRIQDLFNGITAHKPDAGGSILIPFAFAALITVIGILLRSRLLVTLAGLITIAFTVLWMVRVGIAEHSLAISSGGRGLGLGVGDALIGGVLMLLGAGLMRGRRAPAPAPAPPGAPGAGTGGTGAYAAPPPYEDRGAGAPVDGPYGTGPGAPVDRPYETGSAGAPLDRPYETGSAGAPLDRPYQPEDEHDTLSFSSADLPAELTAPEEPGERGGSGGGATRARPPGE
ncbi:hypothetical protein [Streptomyces sp. NPDC059398]|uniref:hypothetical protein n=1 Tax=Streptomyces sp. NPDC059398 TaxID=3346820 RepID=UPI00367A69BA